MPHPFRLLSHPRVLGPALGALVLSLLVLTAGARAAADPRPHPEREAPDLLLAPTERAVEAPLDYSDIPWNWTGIAFQSFRESDNWEIYHVYGPDRSTRRLTNHPAEDVEPALSRGGDLIAFASDRDGEDLEIYVMNADGSNVRRLSNNNADDARPVWSPDGTRIAYQSYEWGRAELLLMNADGSNVRRLTNDPGYDGDPTWSPDSTQIAFCSTREGNVPAIFVMPAEGGPARRLSTLPDSCDPVWSPDGKSIAFDTSAGPGQLFDVGLMNADGSNARAIFSAGTYTIAQPTSWTPDGRQIVYSAQEYRPYNGNLYLYQLRVEAVSSSDPADWTPALPYSSIRDMYASMTTLDTTPPAVTMSSLPRFSRLLSVGLAWAGSDGENGSGVTTFDLETRRDANAPWTPLLPNTTATAYTATGTAGPVEFRLRARDAAFNVMPWPAAASAATRLFATELSGRVTDNRGVVLPGVAPAIAPQPVTQEPTDDGYVARLSILGSHTLTLNRAGYAPLWPTTRALMVDSRQSIYLPPANNVIRNGDFEAAAGAVDQWTVGGALPVAPTTTQFASGSRAVALGAPCAPPCLVERGEMLMETNAVRVVADSRGGLHMTYLDAAYVNRYRYRPAGGSWSSPVGLPSGGAVLALGIDAQDTLHLAQEVVGVGVCYRQKPWQGAWSACEWPNMPVDTLRLVTGRNGLVCLFNSQAFSSAQVLCRTSGGWQDIRLSDDPLFVADAAVDANGTIHVAYVVYGAETNQWFVRPLLDSTGQPAFALPDDASIYQILFDQAGTLHVWSSSGYGYRRSNGQWSGYGPFLFDLTSGTLTWAAVDSQDTIHVLYHVSGGDNSYHYAHSTPGGGWSAAFTVSPPIQFDAKAVIASDDSLYLFAHAWRLNEGGIYNSIYLIEFGPAPAGPSGAATLSQRVAIPATMSHPTLSFMKRVLGNNGGGATVAARIEEGHNTQSFAITGDARWSLGWLDLSAWAGKTVVVTFAVEQPADAPPAQLYLDAITLGSASPQLWAQLRSPVQAQPGATAAGVLAFGNRGAAEAAGATLTLTLPDGLSLAAATPPAEVTGNTARWSLGALAAGEERSIALTLAAASGAPWGQQRTLRAELTAATPEVELADNRSEQAIFFGWQSFMPGLFKK